MQLKRAAPIALCALLGCARATQSWDFCLKGDDPVIDGPELREDESAFDRAMAEGRTETFLTERGCRRYRHARVGGVERTDEVVVVGTKDGQPVFRIRERKDRTAELMRISQDPDNDGLDEVVTRHFTDEKGERTRVDEMYAPKTHVLRERVTRISVGPDRQRTIEEAPGADGGLEVTSDHTGPIHAPRRTRGQ